jgi:hypothetical protein
MKGVWVAWLGPVNVTVAAGIAAPEGSVTWPLSVPLPVCAKAAAETETTTSSANKGPLIFPRKSIIIVYLVNSLCAWGPTEVCFGPLLDPFLASPNAACRFCVALCRLYFPGTTTFCTAASF